MDKLFEARMLIKQMNFCLLEMQKAAEKGDQESLALYGEIAEKYMEASEHIMRGESVKGSPLSSNSECTEGSSTAGALAAE
jgi:hypothetical protein